MKIIRLTTLLDFGGQEQQYISFTENSTLHTHEYIFVCIGYGGYASNLIEKRGFRVLILNQKFSIKNLKNIFVLYKIFKQEKPDIVHTASAEANFHGIIAAKLAGVKKIYAEEIGIPKHSKMARIVFSHLYRYTTKVICVSKAVKNHLIEIEEIKPEKGIVLYNPVSKPKVYDKKQKNNFEIVFVGRLVKVKNVETLIKAFAQLDKKAFLTIVGDGIEKVNLENLAKKLNIENQIRFVGFCNEPSKYVSQADLFVLPSFSEGFGIAAVEAIYQSVPCLCSNVGGITEFIINGKTGWLFDPNNLEELTIKLKMIMMLPKAELQKVVKESEEKVITNFTVEKYCINLEKIYNGEN
jgi:glycosyltransferase involved in cell wall biosynthesis